MYLKLIIYIHLMSGESCAARLHTRDLCLSAPDTKSYIAKNVRRNED